MKKHAFVAAVALAAVFAAEAQVKPEDQIKQRRSGYAVMGYNFANLGAMAQEKKPYNKEEAGKFLAFILSDEGQQVIANVTAPTRPGFESGIPVINDLVAMSTNPANQNYPMFDNFTQPGVTDTLVRNIALVLVGEMSPKDGLASMDAAFAALPEEQKAVDIGLTSN